MNSIDQPICPQCRKPLPADAPGGLCPSCVMAMNLSPETRMTGVGSHGLPTPPPSPEEIAEQFPNFDILECLGRGGMGVVYKARQKALDREVAIKVLAGEWEGDAAFAERFEREAKILAQMSHPNIVTIHDFGQSDGLYYIVMEYVDGVNLCDLLSDGKMAPEQALAIVPPICEALEYAHSKGIVHRDIKPANLLLDRDGRVKIADFGIASLVGATTDVSGTPSYMAPEQAKGSVDCRTDIYALGVVLYEMLTGERPAKEVVPPSKKIEVDVKIDEMVLRALEREPERRYQSAHEFQTTAEFVMSTPPGPAQEGAANVSPVEQSTWKSPDSGWGWFVGKLFGITFTSPTAYRLANLSALGFLGFLGILGNLPIPGARGLSGLYGFFGFSGLIGLAHMIELWQRENGRTMGTQQASNSPASKPPVYSPWESSIVLLGMIFSIAMIFPVLELPDLTRYQCYQLMFLLLTTFCIAVTSLAGLWPFPSPLFPEPCFSSRNLRRNRIDGGLSGGDEQASNSPASKPPIYSPWESLIALLGMVFSVVMIFPVLELPDLTRYQCYQLMFLLLTTFCIAVTSLVGLWPFPSPLFPEPCFSSRNLRRNRIQEDGQSFQLHSMLVAIGAVVLAVLVGAFVVSEIFTQRDELAHDGINFGPERKVVLLNWEYSEYGPRFLDLDSALTHPGPKEGFKSDAETRRWMNVKGFELFAETIDGHWGLVTTRTSGLKLARIPSSQLAEITTDDLLAVLAQSDSGLEVKDEDGDDGWRGYFLPSPLPAGFALAFRTAGGALGILKIDMLDNDSQRLEMRCQLLQDGKYQQATEIHIETDRVIIEDLALHMIVAIREKDDQKLKSLASDQIKDWRKSLPVFAVELRERCRQILGNEKFDLQATKSIVSGNLGVVRCTGPSELKGKCLILFFVKDAGGWKNCLLRNSIEGVELSEHLAYLVEAIRSNLAKKGRDIQ